MLPSKAAASEEANRTGAYGEGSERCENDAGSLFQHPERYSVSSLASKHLVHCSRSGTPCALQKCRWHRPHSMKLILIRSSASQQ